MGDDDYIRVAFPNLDGNHDKNYRKDNFEVYPRGTYTKDLVEWVDNIKVGDEVDCCDPFFTWYRSTVLEIKEETVLAKDNPDLVIDRHIK